MYVKCSLRFGSWHVQQITIFYLFAVIIDDSATYKSLCVTTRWMYHEHLKYGIHFWLPDFCIQMLATLLLPTDTITMLQTNLTGFIQAKVT